jgi:hypothetical protein
VTASRLAEIYAHYVAFCTDLGIDPALFTQWLFLTDSLLPLPRVVPRHDGGSEHRAPNSATKSATREAIDAGLFVGELRPDGSVGTVRPQTAPIGIGKSVLTARTCRACGEYLPSGQFSKKRKSIRATCKRCDNESRRRAKTSTD